jgi:hypothetical protein
VCGNPARAWPYPQRECTAHGFARIDDGKKQTTVLLCEACFAAEEKIGATILRKYLNAPDLTISEGGTYDSADQLRRDYANARKEHGNKRRTKH